jgi:hypothetical protein
MGSGQMLITMGAMILLSIIILTVNSGYLRNNDMILDSKFDILAVSLAVSYLEDANGLAFDERTTGGFTATNVNQLSSLGKDVGEYYVSRDSNNFNDFDDYNNLSVVYNDSTLESAIFNINTKVGYVSDSNPNVFINYKTWYKKLDVYVSSQSMTDTIKMSTVLSYFYFR